MLLVILTLLGGAGIIAAVFWLQLIKKSSSKPSGPPTILLLGPSFSGKTSLLSEWQASEEDEEGSEKAGVKPVTTVTSVEPNVRKSAHFEGFQIVDCPGNERLQMYVKKHLHLNNVKAIVYLIDASSGQAKIKESALVLAKILAYAEKNSIPVLIATNKHDLFNTVSVQSIRKTLESEIEIVKQTGDHDMLSSVSANENSDFNDAIDEEDSASGIAMYLGIEGKPFAFSDLEIETDILDGSVKTKKLAKWDSWLESVLN